jgi:hypothetical protein
MTSTPPPVRFNFFEFRRRLALRSIILHSFPHLAVSLVRQETGPGGRLSPETKKVPDQSSRSSIRHQTKGTSIEDSCVLLGSNRGKAAYVFADPIQNCARSDLGTAILAALADAGKDVNHLQPEDLAPVDEFHTHGRQGSMFSKSPKT